MTVAPDALVVGEMEPHAAPMQFVPVSDHVTKAMYNALGFVQME